MHERERKESIYSTELLSKPLLGSERLSFSKPVGPTCCTTANLSAKTVVHRAGTAVSPVSSCVLLHRAVKSSTQTTFLSVSDLPDQQAKAETAFVYCVTTVQYAKLELLRLLTIMFSPSSLIFYSLFLSQARIFGHNPRCTVC